MFKFPSFEPKTPGTLLDSVNAKQVKAFIEAFNSMRVVMGAKNAAYLSDRGFVIELDLSGVTNAIAALESAVSGLESRVSALEGDVGTLQGEVATLQGEVSALQGDVGTLQGQVGSLETDVSALQGDVGTLQGEMLEVQEYIEGIGTVELETCDGTVTVLTPPA